MKFELPENAGEAFQFLSIGAGVILVIRLAIWSIGLIADTPNADPLIAAIANYRNGYLLLDHSTLVVGGMAMIPRIAVAVLFVLATALIVAVFGYLITGLIRSTAMKGAVQGTRIGLLLSTGWVIYALLALPPVSVRVSANDLSILERPTFLHAIAFPFGSNERTIKWSDIDYIRHQPETHTKQPDRKQQVVVISGEEVITIAQLMDESATNGPGALETAGEAQLLVDQLTILRSTVAR